MVQVIEHILLISYLFLYNSSKSNADYSLVCFNATNLQSCFFSAWYIIGPLIFFKSCVPIETNFLLLQIFWCNLSCKPINELYDDLVKLTPFNIHATTFDLIFNTFSFIVIDYSFVKFDSTNL